LAFGQAFLVLSGVKLKPARAPQVTLGSPETTDVATTTGTFTVFPVLKRPEAPFDFVTVGRASGNDVVIAHPSISKFHAFLRQQADGFWLQDGGSRNGTLQNGAAVASRGKGNPSLLRPGDRLRFGSVPVTFLLAEGMLDLVRELKGTAW
jgi:ABC transport system ATP-binding/permease protein